ncbi:MAG: aspartate ammonia-lyase [Candidatus Marinimicrobia bacterium]|nr:aspartate ammonia-lyase [Candidatus Neomarinimicrobiota bacterium]
MRVERDSMGNIKVPKKAYYGAQTMRASNNFKVSDDKIPLEIIYAIVIIKRSAAIVNHSLNKLNSEYKVAIVKASDEILQKKYDDQFLIDVYQTGSGTSTNMNVNEVIANRANEILGYDLGSNKPIHPNDHVNMGQSSNDVIPSSIHIAAKSLIHNKLTPALSLICDELKEKSEKFNSIIKIGRTHLQDATPIRMGQEFSGYYSSISNCNSRVTNALTSISDLAQGGTAVGTGINTHPDFGKLISVEISKFTKLEFNEASNHFEAQASQDAVVELSGSLKSIAVSMTKIASDIRLMGTGPRCGIGELIIPAVQPGSSIMPGKVNPVICESMLQVCVQVIANDLSITLGAQGGNFELNVMLPLIGSNLVYSINILSNSIVMFTDKLLKNLKVDEKKCKDYIEKSLSMCTILVPEIGYDKTAKLAYEAYNSGKNIRELLLEKNILPSEKVEDLLNPFKMTEPLK